MTALREDEYVERVTRNRTSKVPALHKGIVGLETTKGEPLDDDITEESTEVPYTLRYARP